MTKQQVRMGTVLVDNTGSKWVVVDIYLRRCTLGSATHKTRLVLSCGLKLDDNLADTIFDEINDGSLRIVESE